MTAQFDIEKTQIISGNLKQSINNNRITPTQVYHTDNEIIKSRSISNNRDTNSVFKHENAGLHLNDKNEPKSLNKNNETIYISSKLRPQEKLNKTGISGISRNNKIITLRFNSEYKTPVNSLIPYRY